MTKHTILFLAANPAIANPAAARAAGLAALRIDEEARDIEEEIRRESRRDRFAFVARPTARPLDLLRALREVRPTIVHFAGHSQTGGIYVVDDQGQPQLVTRPALHETFGAAGRSVQIVVLNGCATEEIARALSVVVPVAVGTSAAIGDRGARTFSVSFYGALAAGESAASACRQGKAAMHLESRA